MKGIDECKPKFSSFLSSEKKKKGEREKKEKKQPLKIYSFVGVFILLHLLVFGFGFIHYSLKVRISKIYRCP